MVWGRKGRNREGRQHMDLQINLSLRQTGCKPNVSLLSPRSSDEETSRGYTTGSVQGHLLTVSASIVEDPPSTQVNKLGEPNVRYTYYVFSHLIRDLG